MKVQSNEGPLIAQDVFPVGQPVKVCMHVLERVRTDERVLREAKTLAEAGFGVSIIDIENERDCPVEEDIRGIHVRHVIMPGWFNYTWHFDPLFLIKAFFMLLRCMLQLIRTPADIFHAHDAKALPATFVAAWLHRKPLIFDAHELPVTEITARWCGLTKVSRYLIGRIVPHCAGVITVSRPIASEMSKRYLYPEVTLIRNVPAYKRVHRSDRLRKHLGLGPDALIALYQGHLQPDRQLDRLVRAAKFLRDGRVIVLMGKSVGPTAHQLEALARKEGVGDRLKILPPVPYEELLEWTASADTGLIIYAPDQSLNVKFCLPNKLFEYLMAGLPVLSTHLDAVADMLSTYEVGRVVFSLRPEDIGAAINEMLADRTALAYMHSRALEVVQHDLCWETESEELVRLYQEVLGMQQHTTSQGILS
jgi:glycosyltransferase involved in cell wall biosynthesis